ncbi:hypothetical protein PF587_09360, partial [Lactobacillus delbrueckii]
IRFASALWLLEAADLELARLEEDFVELTAELAADLAADLELAWLEEDFVELTAELAADLAADLELALLSAFFSLLAWLD